MKHHTKYKGDVGLTHVLADVVKQNWFVSLPIQEHAPYDFVATKGNTVRRVQVKFRTVRKGAMEVHKRNAWGNATKGAVRGELVTSKDVDTYAVTDGARIAYVPIDDSTETFMIRVSPPKNNQRDRCHFIEDYEELS